MQLPVKSTPLDFAFQVHSEVGKTCLGAKVNHKVVPLNTELQNGDTVEVITSSSQSPSYGWLKFAITSKARNQIKRFLSKQEREESAKMGVENTKKMTAKIGRATTLGERSIGHPDPGALSLWVILKAASDYINNN